MTVVQDIEFIFFCEEAGTVQVYSITQNTDLLLKHFDWFCARKAITRIYQKHLPNIGTEIEYIERPCGQELALPMRHPHTPESD